jgi:hypothetical protein
VVIIEGPLTENLHFEASGLTNEQLLIGKEVKKGALGIGR